MALALIAAMARGRVIGYQNQLPWHIATDLKHFKTLTTGKTVIMGSKTYHSIGRPLPHRQNIVITRNKDLNLPGCVVVHNITDALRLANVEEQDVFIIGGAQLYKQTLALADKLYLTLLDLDAIGDTYFPDWKLLDWHETSSEHFFDEAAQIGGKFITLERLSS